ncbi:class I SAM-dependent methyltransferase [Alkalibacterium subtropicum]|uniref:class I SAM-dependent methyltransferase n=1 Tax=Alkalibacterium subtropicum TaxID=753702 RepID=UPI0015A61B8B|nr:class I SAM-dependent methyltransferase [Alkalibacterium subtropicum]
MDTSKVEKFYTVLLESTRNIKEDLDSTFVEAFIETGENILDNGKVHVEDGLPHPETRDKLIALYNSVSIEELSLEEKKKAIQMMLISIVKEDQLQVNHQPTPDGIGVILSYFIDLFFETDEPLHLADLSVGSGNLLYTLFTTLFSENKEVKLTGVDNDELLISLASTISAILHIPVHLMHQDALQPLLLDPVDLMISDLPVGFYPIDVKKDDFKTRFEEGHSYSHYLLIEQGMKYLKESGYAFYILPTNVFETEEVKSLLKYVHSVGHVQAIIHMPLEWFSSVKSRKSLFIIQKKGEGSKQVSEVLVSDVPNIKDQKTFNEFILSIKKWKKEQQI